MKGSFDIVVRHSCGQDITVRVSWSDYPGTLETPPEHDEEWDHDEICPTCHLNLVDDDVFQEAINFEVSDSVHYEELDYDP